MTLSIINFCINLAIVGTLIWFDRRHKKTTKDLDTKILRANPATRKRR